MSTCNFTQPIDGTECIGDSLYNRINPNFASLDTAVCNLSTNFLNVVNSSTIDLFFNTPTRTLSANINTSMCFRNKLINGNFDVWQRGTTRTASNDASFAGFYIADRWGFSPNTGGTVTVSRQQFNISQTTVPNNPTYYLNYQCSIGSTFPPLLYQRIENVRSLAGKTVTLSFWAKSTAPISILIGYTYWYGITPQTNTIAETINTTTTWQKYSITTTLPNINNSVSLNNNNSVAVVFNFPQSSTFNCDIAQVQLEEGPTATPFEVRPIGLETSLCQRYYELGGHYIDNNNNTADFVWRFLYPYKVEKRSTPALILSSNPWIGGTTAVGASPAGFTTFAGTFLSVVAVAVPSTAPVEYSFAFAIDAEL
jgi:hypothetical protein